MSQKKEKEIPVHTTMKCVGGPVSGAKLRVFADNPREVRQGKKMEFNTPIHFSTGNYIVVGKELHWEGK